MNNKSSLLAGWMLMVGGSVVMANAGEPLIRRISRDPAAISKSPKFRLAIGTGVVSVQGMNENSLAGMKVTALSEAGEKQFSSSAPASKSKFLSLP